MYLKKQQSIYQVLSSFIKIYKMTELTGLVPINRAEFLAFQRQTKHDILLEKLKQTEIIYSEANLAIQNATTNISLFNNSTDHAIIQLKDPWYKLQEMRSCISDCTRIIMKETVRKSRSILKYRALIKQIYNLKRLLPEGKRLIKEAKIAAKKNAQEFARLEAVNRCFVASEADKRISSARLLMLPEDILFVIKSFFTYETRIELLETAYPLMLRLNKLSCWNTRELICCMHKRPNYLAKASAKTAEMLIRFPYACVPTNHVKRKEYILHMIQKYKIHCPVEAIHLLRTVTLLHF
jgi:hypothetical protein